LRLRRFFRHVFVSSSGVFGDMVASEVASVSSGEFDRDAGGVVGSRAISGDSGEGPPAATPEALSRSTCGSS
jgi:hypothetical protein